MEQTAGVAASHAASHAAGDMDGPVGGPNCGPGVGFEENQVLTFPGILFCGQLRGFGDTLGDNTFDGDAPPLEGDLYK